jgi:hypothetical protein
VEPDGVLTCRVDASLSDVATSAVPCTIRYAARTVPVVPCSRRLLGLALSFLSLLVATSGVPGVAFATQPVTCTSSAATSDPPGPNVMVVGDSLSFGEWCYSKSAVADYTARGLIARVDAKVGRFASAGVKIVQAHADSLPTKLVFALGTNDLSSTSSPTTFRSQLDAVVGLAGLARQVFLVTVHSKANPLLANAYNLHMHAIAQQTRNVTVIDWASVVQANPDLVAGDGIHLSVSGYRRRSAYIAAHVAIAPETSPSTQRIGSPAGFTAVQPERVADSRQGNGAAQLRAGRSQRVQVAGLGGVPFGATAAAMNVAVTGTAARGHLTVHPCGEVPGVSTLNWPSAGWTVANATIASLDRNGGTCLRSTADTQVVVDVTGYFSASSTGRFNPITPVRAGDTRLGDVPRTDAAYRFVVAGLGTIPAEATAVSVNIAVVNAARAGHAVAYPCGEVVPPTSSVNVMAGVNVQSNNAIVPVGEGAVCVVTSAPANVVVDVTGWFGSSGRSFQALAPIRLLDTRSYDAEFSGGLAGRALTARQTVKVPVAGVRGIPADAVAASLNISAVGQTRDGYVAVYPAGTDWPGTSTVNAHGGRVDANGVQVALGGTSVTALVLAPGHLVIDISGVWV